jgi:hypothetical protein
MPADAVGRLREKFVALGMIDAVALCDSHEEARHLLEETASLLSRIAADLLSAPSVEGGRDKSD